MYHYASSSDERPVLTLGEQIWKFEGKNLLNGGEEVVFTTRVPDRPHIKITKTYRLGAKDYHLGLVLQFERDGGDAKDEQFNYQLTGAYG
jgi:hypothetical protein